MTFYRTWKLITYKLAQVSDKYEIWSIKIIILVINISYEKCLDQKPNKKMTQGKTSPAMVK